MRWLAGFLFLTVMVSVVFFFLVGQSLAHSSPGEHLFIQNKCNECHTVSSAGITAEKKDKAPDLTNVGVRHTKDWMKKFVKKEVGHTSCKAVDAAEDGSKHKKKYKGTDAELDQIIDWLDKQRNK